MSIHHLDHSQADEAKELCPSLPLCAVTRQPKACPCSAGCPAARLPNGHPVALLGRPCHSRIALPRPVLDTIFLHAVCLPHGMRRTKLVISSSSHLCQCCTFTFSSRFLSGANGLESHSRSALPSDQRRRPGFPYHTLDRTELASLAISCGFNGLRRGPETGLLLDGESWDEHPGSQRCERAGLQRRQAVS
ncbi:uncharacterized protein LY79DRAFT_358954 [Colletotrichum navitas]|uniref:Uncharacterized protein n=1 Tax=Colletotrichum navitas TaxID=681940 RepID=A0AAD8PS15_9PEZI|nr:uncharacterized protein LY79DRAFT_358954 [Colletotrichum navitas]KAK1574746.1 hypothetical protein LY79DRAFT_358954 [Colletotrichum navitas]